MFTLLLRHSRLASKAIATLLCAFTLQNLSAQEFVWAPDFPVGSALPEISAQDQDGVVRSFADLKGENGLVFVFSRSFDW